MEQISNKKIQRLVKKEEQIAKAYKEFINTKGNAPTLDELISNKLLPDGFSKDSFFKSIIQLEKNKHQIRNIFSTKLKLRTSLLDYYYNDENRVYTKAAISENNKNINIILNEREKYILKFKDSITTNKSNAKNKYYLDPQGILHWYNNSNKYKFSYSKENLIIDSSVDMFDSFGNTTTEFNSLFENKEILFAGQTIFLIKSGGAQEYLNLGEQGGYIKVGDNNRDIGKTILQFTRRAGGIIINGDIYTWGNNDRNVVATGKKTYVNRYGNTGTGLPVVTTLVRAKAFTYDSRLDSRKYFSSPLRPKFVDFTSDVWHSTCGVTTNGELYCAGRHALDQEWAYFQNYNRSTDVNQEFLHRSTFFDGSSKKALRLFGLIATWVVLGNEGGSEDSGYIYFWGDNNRGYGGTGKNNERDKRTPIKASNIKFKDVTYTLSIPYRRIGALSVDGDIYTWGLDNNITNGNSSCTQNIYEGGRKNLCTPWKVETNVTFTSILGGQQTFLGTDEVGDFYRISQPKINGKASKAKVHKINDLIKSYSDYNSEEDGTILSVDISSKLNGSSLQLGQGIVWVNGKNKLKGDYFTAENKNDKFFKAAIDKIKWKKIRVVEDKNGMCGIDIYNQMYCWGAMSFYAGSNAAGNTFMLPMFMANLHDLDKDFMLAAGGKADGLSSNVTNMTSGDWSRGSKGEYFIKYPTYFGGFNYEFTFK